MEASTSALDSKPVSVFESQTHDEKLILLLRAHAVTNVPWIIMTVILGSIPAVIAVTGILDTVTSQFNIPSESLDGFSLIWYLLVFAYAFQNFLNWYFNIYILTDRRVVDLDFFQLLYKRLSSAHLSNIEDITISMGGVAQAIFHYGDIHIQTAGTVTNFEFHRVPNPSLVKQKIESALFEYKKNIGDEE